MDAGPRHPRLGLDAQKKTLAAAERSEEQRQNFRAQLATRPADDFVIVDETGSNLNLTPRYARAPRGERAQGSIPRNTPPNSTLIAAMTLDGMGAAMVLDGATDTQAFEVYVEHFLVPTLRPGQVVVLDNLSAHNGTRVRELISISTTAGGAAQGAGGVGRVGLGRAAFLQGDQKLLDGTVPVLRDGWGATDQQ